VSAQQTRKYYIAAEDVLWNYSPINEPPPEGDTWLSQATDRIGRINKKIRYVQYTDATFATKSNISADWEHLAILGPLIRAEVGDTIEVTFRNRVPAGGKSLSVHAHALFYTKANEGLDGVAPGQTKVYTWQATDRTGPGPKDPSAVLWLYHSHIDVLADYYTGLYGPILITRKGAAKSAADPTPTDVQREFVVSLGIFDETFSHYIDDNIRTYAPAAATLLDPLDADFQEANKKHTINGRMYNNVPGLTAVKGETVRWYVAGFGDEEDVHTAHWHAQTVVEKGERKDVLDLLPAQTRTVEMIVDTVGSWQLHCHVQGHGNDGMQTQFEITGTPDTPVVTGVTRTYFIAADQVTWDYAPSNFNLNKS
jgi:FtsP/CotA-like multicopper oxidase with cupredoxin domain